MFRDKNDQEMELHRLQREVRDASNRLQAMHTKSSTAEKVSIYNYIRALYGAFSMLWSEPGGGEAYTLQGPG